LWLKINKLLKVEFNICKKFLFLFEPDLLKGNFFIYFMISRAMTSYIKDYSFINIFIQRLTTVRPSFNGEKFVIFHEKNKRG